MFYRVKFEDNDNEYFFHDHENAAAFLIESYFDDNDIESEDDVMAVNNEVADFNMISLYGYIDKLLFEDE